MNAALCEEIGGKAFPTPAQVAAAGVEALQSRCGVGYRAKSIHGLARQVQPPALCTDHALVDSKQAMLDANLR